MLSDPFACLQVRDKSVCAILQRVFRNEWKKRATSSKYKLYPKKHVPVDLAQESSKCVREIIAHLVAQAEKLLTTVTENLKGQILESFQQLLRCHSEDATKMFTATKNNGFFDECTWVADRCKWFLTALDGFIDDATTDMLQDLGIAAHVATSPNPKRRKMKQSDEVEEGKEQIRANSRMSRQLSLNYQDLSPQRSPNLPDTSQQPPLDPQCALCPQCTGRSDDDATQPWGKLPFDDEIKYCKACCEYWRRWKRTGTPKMRPKHLEIKRVARNRWKAEKVTRHGVCLLTQAVV